jgi:hypothetical protein
MIRPAEEMTVTLLGAANTGAADRKNDAAKTPANAFSMFGRGLPASRPALSHAQSAAIEKVNQLFPRSTVQPSARSRGEPLAAQSAAGNDPRRSAAANAK